MEVNRTKAVFKTFFKTLFKLWFVLEGKNFGQFSV